MKWQSLIVVFILVLFAGSAFSQEEGSASASRKKNLRKWFDYRYKGGYYSFEKKFNNNIQYPDFARMNCILGIVVVSLYVDCEGVPRDIQMKTSLGYGTSEELTNFFSSTMGEWNKCEDDKYTRVEIPIQFFIEGTETNSTDALLICEGEMPGHNCNPDDYYFKKAKKAFDKGNSKKAEKFLKVLVVRDPYNTTYTDMLTKTRKLMSEK